jgi:predicted Zn finger-like uncharacterized protein
MSLSEKAAYLRGLYDGMELDKEKSKEARLLNAMIDVIGELADYVSENEESIGTLADQLDDMAEVIDVLKDAALGEDSELDSLDEEDDDEDDFLTTVEVECPSCQAIITLDEDDIASGEIQCPTCGQRFQIDVDFEDDEEEDADTEGELQF